MRWNHQLVWYWREIHDLMQRHVFCDVILMECFFLLCIFVGLLISWVLFHWNKRMANRLQMYHAINVTWIEDSLQFSHVIEAGVGFLLVMFQFHIFSCIILDVSFCYSKKMWVFSQLCLYVIRRVWLFVYVELNRNQQDPVYLGVLGPPFRVPTGNQVFSLGISCHPTM